MAENVHEHIRARQAELENVLGRSRDKEPFWHCSICGTRNSLSRTSCKKCKATLQNQLSESEKQTK